MKMALPGDGEDIEWLHSLLLDVQLEHFHTRIIDELQVRKKSKDYAIDPIINAKAFTKFCFNCNYLKSIFIFR